MRTLWILGFLAAAALSFCLPDFVVFRFTQAAIWAIALLGLVVLCGISGQFSFAQAALFGIGGYATAMLASHTPLSAYWGLPAGALAGYGAGWALGRIAGGHSVWTQALVTYAFAIAFPQLLRWRLVERWTGGVNGLYLDFPVPPAGLGNDRWTFLVALALLGGGLWLVHNLVDSRSGRAMRAARDHDVAALAQGIRVVEVRAVASGLAGAFIAVAGCLSSWQFGYVGPGSYGFGLSVQMLFGLVIGGLQAPAGAIVGGLFLQFFPDLVAGLGRGLSGLLFAVLLIAAILVMPRGLAGAAETALAKLRRRPSSGP